MPGGSDRIDAYLAGQARKFGVRVKGQLRPRSG
jgi:hypothetical protein